MSFWCLIFFLTFAGGSSRTNNGKGPVTDAPRRSAKSSNAAVQQAWEKVQYVERNLEECYSLNRDETRQRLIAFKDEEFYKIVAINRPWVTDNQSIVPRPTFFFGDAVLDDLTYQMRCFQFSYTKDGEERTVATRSTFDRTISIMSLSPTCFKREDPPSWVKRTNVIKTGIFVGGPSGYAEKSLARMDMLMPASGNQGSNHPSVDLRPVGLSIFRGDDSNWVKSFRLHNRFSADSSWQSWTNHILQIGGAILKEAEIFNTVALFGRLWFSSANSIRSLCLSIVSLRSSLRSSGFCTFSLSPSTIF
ncbi:hypothetical protein AAC387_Pa01g2602 [Persea americana]